MMLRNRSPVASATSNAKCSANLADHNNTNSCVGVSNASNTAVAGELNRPRQHSANVASPVTSPPKPTHRRGFSHGSYSSLNPSASSTSSLGTTNPTNLLRINNSQILTNSLGRSANSSLEAQLNENSQRSLLHHLNKEFEVKNMRTSSSEQLNSEENLTMVSNNSANVQSQQANAATPNEEAKRAINHIEQKIRRTKESIKTEQMRMDDNVNEYLRLSGNAEPGQAQSLKSVFEKKNLTHAQNISRLQKKLKRYDQNIKSIKERGFVFLNTRERLRDVGTNIKEGISGISGGVIEGIKSGIHTAGETVIAKPKEFFKRNTTDNSADKSNYESQDQSGGGLGPVLGDSDHPTAAANSNSHSHSQSTRCTSDDESSSITSGSGHLGSQSHNSAPHGSSPLRVKSLKSKIAMNEVMTPTISNATPLDFYTAAEIEQLRTKLDERTQECSRLNHEMSDLKVQMQTECSNLNQVMQEEKYRVELLNEQLMDLTELHQKEIENLKQTITDLEEKIQYQAEEKHRDVHEMLESFQTRISRMEHQQHQHLQQLVNLDSLDNSNARALILKVINVLLTVLQVILLLVATIVNVLAPFLQTRMRIFTSAALLIILLLVFQNWSYLSQWTQHKLDQIWPITTVGPSAMELM